ncbi:hypothetical protein D1J63_14535 [Streptomyces sp. KPB2]|nr:hypothetical protein D1J63_14535 [Streptomyces sp. KPB2]
MTTRKTPNAIFCRRFVGKSGAGSGPGAVGPALGPWVRSEAVGPVRGPVARPKGPVGPARGPVADPKAP